MSTELLLKDYLHRLKLPAVARHYKSLARTAAENGRSYEEYLCALFEQEVLAREESALKNRIRRANFPYPKTLEDFDFTALPSLSKPKVLTLSRGEYIMSSFWATVERARRIWPLPWPFAPAGKGTGCAFIRPRGWSRNF